MTSSNQSLSGSSFRKTVLIVDDDPHIREVIRFALKKAGFQTCEAADGRQCLENFQQQQPDIIILDILMPEMDGNKVCSMIRASSDTPIIFLSSIDDEVDRIIGLESGADDYVTKPFSPRELVARVKAILKRSSGYERQGEHDEESSHIIQHGCLSIDADRFLVSWAGTDISMTATEFSLLMTLAGYPGKVFSRDELLDRTYDGVLVSDRTIDSHIRKIRKKFSRVNAEPIETVRGVGYRLSNCL